MEENLFAIVALLLVLLSGGLALRCDAMLHAHPLPKCHSQLISTLANL